MFKAIEKVKTSSFLQALSATTSFAQIIQNVLLFEPDENIWIC